MNNETCVYGLEPTPSQSMASRWLARIFLLVLAFISSVFIASQGDAGLAAAGETGQTVSVGGEYEIVPVSIVTDGNKVLLKFFLDGQEINGGIVNRGGWTTPSLPTLPSGSFGGSISATTPTLIKGGEIEDYLLIEANATGGDIDVAKLIGPSSRSGYVATIGVAMNDWGGWGGTVAVDSINSNTRTVDAVVGDSTRVFNVMDNSEFASIIVTGVSANNNWFSSVSEEFRPTDSSFIDSLVTRNFGALYRGTGVINTRNMDRNTSTAVNGGFNLFVNFGSRMFSGNITQGASADAGTVVQVGMMGSVVSNGLKGTVSSAHTGGQISRPVSQGNNVAGTFLGSEAGSVNGTFQANLDVGPGLNVTGSFSGKR